MASVRIAALAVALVSFAALGTVIGCAGPGAQIMSTSHDDKHDAIQRGYDLGFDRGRSASARGATPDSKMPRAGKQNPETVSAYAQGYEDGYAGRKNRFGAVSSRDWMHENEVPTVSDYDADESMK